MQILGKEISDDAPLSEAIDKNGTVLVEEGEYVAVRREIDSKYRLAQVKHKPSAAAQFTGLVSFNPDQKSSYLSFAINFKKNVRKLPDDFFKDQSDPQTTRKTN